MGEKVVKPERRRLERRQSRLEALSSALDESTWGERRIHCWDLDRECSDIRRKKCAAYFVRRNCWDLWAAEFFPPGRKPCCHGDRDCSECPVTAAKFSGPIPIHIQAPSSSHAERATAKAERPSAFCPFLYSGKETGGVRSDAESKTLFKCQRRPGIQLHSTYVSDVCGSPEYRECTFYDTE